MSEVRLPASIQMIFRVLKKKGSLLLVCLVLASCASMTETTSPSIPRSISAPDGIELKDLLSARWLPEGLYTKSKTTSSGTYYTAPGDIQAHSVLKWYERGGIFLPSDPKQPARGYRLDAKGKIHLLATIDPALIHMNQ